MKNLAHTYLESDDSARYKMQFACVESVSNKPLSKLYYVFKDGSVLCYVYIEREGEYVPITFPLKNDDFVASMLAFTARCAE